jgi:hypothetical protein
MMGSGQIELERTPCRAAAQSPVQQSPGRGRELPTDLPWNALDSPHALRHPLLLLHHGVAGQQPATGRWTPASIYADSRLQVQDNGIAHIILRVSHFEECVAFYDG